MRYYVWTEGCQMNTADSQRVAGALEALGYAPAARAEEADVVVLNTCVVRQSAEDKAYGRLTSLRPLKKTRPEAVINLMGCLVGRGGAERLRMRFPWVDVFSPPSDPRPLVEFLLREREVRAAEETLTALRFALQDDLTAGLARMPFLLPASEHGLRAAAFVPAVLGCSHACTFCIIPCRRGGECSRLPEDILAEVRTLAEGGVREVTLLGQIVDRYGMDRKRRKGERQTDLSGLLRRMHDVDGIERIRFLTSHPSWMSEDLLETVADLPKVCEHIEVPVQSGDDEILARMKRGYTAEEYRRLIGRIRAILPGASIATDVIVGFPGETAEQFQRTCDLLAELAVDTAHLARYSPRPGTYAARRLPDDVPPEEKMRRFRELETLQERISVEKNRALHGSVQDVLVEGRRKGRWFGRTRTNRLVFFDDPAEWTARTARVEITRTSAWSLQGRLHNTNEEV